MGFQQRSDAAATPGAHLLKLDDPSLVASEPVLTMDIFAGP